MTAERTPAGLILPAPGLAVPADVLIERLQAEIARLRALAAALAGELELLRRRLGEGSADPALRFRLASRRERRATEREARKADRKGRGR